MTTVASDAAGDAKGIAGMTVAASEDVANAADPEAEAEVADDLIATALVMIAPVAMVRAEIVRVVIVPGRKVVETIAVAEIAGKAGAVARADVPHATSATGATGRVRNRLRRVSPPRSSLRARRLKVSPAISAIPSALSRSPTSPR
jgi:hypothetical protein